MFILYSADIPYDRQPWMSYVLFPIILFLSGMQANWAGQDDFFYPSSLNYPGIIFLFFIACNLTLLWIFGRSVCSRIGNCIYIIIVVLLSVVSLLINELNSGVTVLLLGCVVNLFTGMYIVFWPMHQIDCFIFIPPWRTFSVAGLWVILPWLLLNALAAEIGDVLLFYLTELSTVTLGAVIAVGFLKFRIVDTDSDDGTLLQIFSKTVPDDDAWDESWSVRRGAKDGDDEEVSPTQKPAALIKNKEECVTVLCKCGNIVEVPIAANKAVSCPECSHKVTKPDSSCNTRYSR